MGISHPFAALPVATKRLKANGFAFGKAARRAVSDMGSLFAAVLLLRGCGHEHLSAQIVAAGHLNKPGESVMHAVAMETR